MTSYPIHHLCGHGVLGHILTGLVRIPALMANIVAVGIAAELALRTLKATAAAIGFKPTHDSWVMKTARLMTDYNFRPFEEKLVTRDGDLGGTRPITRDGDLGSTRPRLGPPTINSTGQLVANLLVATAISVAGTEFVRVIGGPPHPIYKSLAFLGCLRVSPESYWEGISPLLGRVSAFFGR